MHAPRLSDDCCVDVVGSGAVLCDDMGLGKTVQVRQLSSSCTALSCAHVLHVRKVQPLGDMLVLSHVSGATGHER